MLPRFAVSGNGPRAQTHERNLLLGRLPGTRGEQLADLPSAMVIGQWIPPPSGLHYLPSMDRVAVDQFVLLLIVPGFKTGNAVDTEKTALAVNRLATIVPEVEHTCQEERPNAQSKSNRPVEEGVTQNRWWEKHQADAE